eukprot:1149277-Pelagomonas_calceolata.AAC.1
MLCRPWLRRGMTKKVEALDNLTYPHPLSCCYDMNRIGYTGENPGSHRRWAEWHFNGQICPCLIVG